jgi:translation initiation factor 1
MSPSKKSNLFEMGASFSDDWSSDNKKSNPKSSTIIKVQADHQLHIRYEKRKGKPQTMVGLFYYAEKNLKELHKKVKKSLACGGSIEKDEKESGFYLLFQGDHREKIKALFEKQNWKFKS